MEPSHFLKKNNGEKKSKESAKQQRSTTKTQPRGDLWETRFQEGKKSGEKGAGAVRNGEERQPDAAEKKIGEKGKNPMLLRKEKTNGPRGFELIKQLLNKEKGQAKELLSKK